MNIFIDTEDMEERYGEELYKEYLERENKELKQKIEYYENFEINKTIDKIRLENNKRFKEQQEELESLKQINEEHKKINGELRVENDRLNNIVNELEIYLQNSIYAIEPRGCSINYNCEYDSEEDYINAMKEQNKLNAFKFMLNKLQELKGSDSNDN